MAKMDPRTLLAMMAGQPGMMPQQAAAAGGMPGVVVPDPMAAVPPQAVKARFAGVPAVMPTMPKRAAPAPRKPGHKGKLLHQLRAAAKKHGAKKH